MACFGTRFCCCCVVGDVAFLSFSYLDKLAEDFEEPCGILDVFNDFHRADHIKLLSLF